MEVESRPEINHLLYTVFFIHLFYRNLDGFSQQGKLPSVSLPREIVTCSLQDLIKYFQPPLEGMGHETKQNSRTALRNRQNMFQEEVKLYVRMNE